MGKPDVAIKNWLRNKVRFADFFNGILFDGEQLIKSEELIEANSESDIIVESEKSKQSQQRYRDIIMRWQGITLIMLALENQHKVNYAMPVRNILYDGLSYSEQIRNIWNEIDAEKKRKLSTEELFSTFRKEDKLSPVITVVFYYGSKISWDGPVCLHSMFDVPEDNDKLKRIIEKFVPNYRINLFDISNMGDISRFKSDLHLIFGMLEYKKDKKKLYEYTQLHKDYFSYIDNDTRYATEVLLDADNLLKKFLDKNSENGGVNMCEAIQGIHEDGIELGKIEGIELGKIEGIKLGKIEGIELGKIEGIKLGEISGQIAIICRKVKKGKSIELIADELEDTVQNITPIYEAVINCGADKDAKEIYEYMQSMSV